MMSHRHPLSTRPKSSIPFWHRATPRAFPLLLSFSLIRFFMNASFSFAFYACSIGPNRPRQHPTDRRILENKQNRTLSTNSNKSVLLGEPRGVRFYKRETARAYDRERGGGWVVEAYTCACDRKLEGDGKKGESESKRRFFKIKRGQKPHHQLCSYSFAYTRTNIFHSTGGIRVKASYLYV
jgi:hypothetical protein